ncbi:unsaturated rhamnogalacturonyl hydrolase [Belliella buryatensis]|uniref:Unsaturated rhamnogalacturonyl hydrolase n=1 Tax=Belliella buryatensis TaxID=1500549 RepID=A0A239ACK8_9BACT|nr:glycoside hydrolase family 88 protein [Belliella buryatensis]SNR93102.1 unsaturated rhamnogalacturonyl hydrolase [Belliella buryatensis]
MKTRNIFLYLLVLSTLSACQAQSNTDSNTDQKYAAWMASSEIKRNPEGWTLDFNQKPKWEYTHGLVMMAMHRVWKETGDQQYDDYIRNFIDFMIDDQGQILTYKKSDYNIDRINGGKFLIDVYKETKEEKLRLAIEELRDQMREHPRNSEGGFWHKKVYPHQMWLDGLYMGSPFLAQYAATFDEPALFDDVVNQILVMDKYAYSTETGLYHHAYDESKSERWADPETGLSSNYWGRSIGWFGMALVDVLDYLPQDHPKRTEVLAIVQKLAQGIVKYQHDSGTWYQVIDQGDRAGNYLEASATSMFAYFLLKGAQKGYLNEEFRNAGIKAYKGILKEFIREDEDGGVSLTQICGVAGLGGNPYRDGSYEYYVNEVIRDNDPKGVGPFILAALIYENMEK